ncbi:MAG: signal peptidase II [Pseudomonadota bacterium]
MSRAFWVIIIVALVMLDQISKWFTEAYLPMQDLMEVLPFLGLYRTYNYGVAFSMLSGLGRWPLVFLTLAIIAFVLWLWRSLEPSRILSAFGFALVIAGALGNLIDRIGLGYVIDMIFFHIDALNFQFAVFNLADTFITLGAIAIILDEFLTWKRNSTHTEDPRA